MSDAVGLLTHSDWSARAVAHRDRINALVGPYFADRSSGVAHPVVDFLFTYYAARPAQVTRWHPGFGVSLERARRYTGLRGYVVDDEGTATVSQDHLESRVDLLDATLAITRATAGRPPRFGCFGLHEWAMVYRSDANRHPHPLRLGAAETDAVVERSGLRCTHFDAFRFFTEPARPRNSIALTRPDAVVNEQPGCLHATMDLYRYCLRLSPLIGSELLGDCFELALTARELDMRASPYDLTGVLDMAGRPYEPVPIETAEGRAQYAAEQTAVAERGAALRESVIARCDDLRKRCRGPSPVEQPGR
jgi:hypothetical protein